MGSLPVGISGSRAAAIIGLSQYDTPFSVWQTIMESRQPGFNAEHGYEFIPFQGNAATEFGKAFENPIISLTEDAISDDIVDQERACELLGMSFVTCHLDGKFKRKQIMYEGKSCNHRAFYNSWGKPGTDRIPQSYQVQNQHAMLCSGLTETTMGVLVFPKTVDEWEKMGWVAHYDTINGKWFISRDKDGLNEFFYPESWANNLRDMGFFHTYHIDAKPDTQKILKELYDEFWRKHILEEIKPDSVDYEDVRRIFSEPKGTLVISQDDKIGGESVADIMREYKDINKEIGASGHLAKRKKFIKTQVLKFAADRTTVADDESVERCLFLDESGNRLGAYNKKGFRS